MSEDFLYFLWQFQYFQKTNLQTAGGEALQILAVGLRNTNAGPDFLNGRVLIDGLEWVGNVEMHLRSSDWHRHTHTHDRAYDSVILHVVWENDAVIERPDGSLVPTLALKPLTSLLLLQKYRALLDSREVIPCARQFEGVPELQKRSMLDRALLQRLQRKAATVHEMLARNQQDWEETTYQLLAQNFGFKINAEPMLRLAQGLPLKVLLKHRDNLTQLEALLLGQSGLLTNAPGADDYSMVLEREYAFLATKYGVNSHQLRAHEWKFLRLRPANFPTVRLAQLATLIQQQTSFFSLFIHADTVPQLSNVLHVQQSDYWRKHYLFQKESAVKVPALGKTSVENIIINTVVPLLVAYSEARDNRSFLDKAMGFLEQLPTEKNHVTEVWETLGQSAKNAFDSQAVIELYTHFCQPKHCLSCTIGTTLLRHS
ncbi:DUF2851 family protein [Runella slithyformis]|uniref:DUF2851 family protein n=1 Tax=Runella slithyformis (strain ATCC 29530 / DSM 19594 / LMG 11500 / NCIMB 11436 / LSU 4) TaxID=761193 RepID=A0A7U3ZIQ2_RUNSL|nr:DUF2851 family protein [Runella slithyformis]AEI47887.1 hypothetical protein Runsl_1461 [Runella slithyformis DSM 19594]